jgi:hypothetical protein
LRNGSSNSKSDFRIPARCAWVSTTTPWPWRRRTWGMKTLF